MRARTLGLIFGYTLCFWAVRLGVLTIIAYTVAHDSIGAGMLQRIGDVARANQVLTYGFAAAAFVLLLHLWHPLTRTQVKQVFNFQELRSKFAANALAGAVLAAVLITGSTLGGHMSFLGIYMKFDEVVISVSSSMIFGVSLFVMVIVEEYIFRSALEPRIIDFYGEAHAVLPAALISSAFYLMIKCIQFDLSWVSAINTVLFNLTLSMIARSERSFMASAAFGGTFLVLVHVVFGLPFMGQDMPGLFLLRATSEDGISQLISGGLAGPEAGLVLTVLLVIYMYLPQIRSKKIEV
jgi:hypothetical protein